MTVTVQNTAVTNTFDFWRNRTNELADAMSRLAVTVESSIPTGNAQIYGTYIANGVVANTAQFGTFSANVLTFFTATGSNTTSSLYFGNSSSNVVVNATGLTFANSTVTTTIKSPTDTQSSNGQYYLNANGSWSLVSVPKSYADGGNTSTVGTSAATIDSYLKSTYSSIEYTLVVSDSSANSKVITKILTAHDGGTVYSTEYGTITSNTSIGAFSVDSNTTHVLLNFTPTVSGTTVRWTRILVDGY